VVRQDDLKSATAYLQRFTTLTPDTVPGTTAIGTSAAVLTALRAKGVARIGFFNAFVADLTIDRNVRPNVYDYETAAEIRRVGASSVLVPIMVNDRVVDLPAIHAEGDFFGDRSEFFFLDDPANPLTLRFRIGIRPPDPARVEMAKIMKEPPPTSGDRETLQVVRVSFPCTGAAISGGGGGAGAGGPAGGAGDTGALERSLLDSGQADVYDIFFSFGSAELRAESTPTLERIAAVLRRYPDWRLTIAGHTDSIAADAHNLDLSRRRAAAVRDALVSRHGITAARLTTTGYGESRPKDTNDTLEGRARNRRVELVRQRP
jgi:outer membrane protein OmpA-like peptidoglycan-associated protein